MLAAGTARAQPAPAEAVDAGFLLSELTEARFVEAALGVGTVACELCGGPTASAALLDLTVHAPIAPGLAASGTVTVARMGRRSDDPTGSAEWTLTPARLALRHRRATGPWTLALAVEVVMPLGVGITVERVTRHVRDDVGRYPEVAGGARLEAAAAWRHGRVRAQAQLTAAVEGLTSGDHALRTRGGVGAAVAVTGSLALFGEAAATLTRSGPYCDSCERSTTLPSLHVAVGARAHVGPWRFGVMALVPVIEPDQAYALDPSVAATAVVGRGF